MTQPLSAVRSWYDRLAWIYDPLTDLAFRYRRRQAIQRLEITEGLTVLDVACGTGLNFAAIAKRLGVTGTLIGVDYSEGMLERARRKIARRGWKNVHLVRADAAKLTLADLVSATGKADPSIDRAICTLGLSVIPEWESAFRSTFALLRPGGRYAVMDCYFERKGFVGKTMDRVAGADSTRRFWEPLRSLSVSYEEKDHWFYEGILRIAVGVKGDD